MEKTFLFYDLETTGLNKCFDQVVQFAAIRTDAELNEIERHEFYVKLNPDVIPSPKAFITHRIPLFKLNEGLDEYSAIKKIHALMNQPGTISIGYNNLNFDDEFLRFSFYRNLLTPYTHQYANACGRMDLYPMTVMYHLFKPNSLKWPDNNLKLENINHLNQLAHGMAHNAMVDVIATLALARNFYNERQMWNYVAGYFDKNEDLKRCNSIAEHKFFSSPAGIHIDGTFGFEKRYQTVALFLGNHNTYKNQSLWLRLDNTNFSSLTLDNFAKETWVINKKMGEPSLVLPMLDRYILPYLKTQQDLIATNMNWLQQNQPILNAITQHYCNYTYPRILNVDADAALYQNGFLSFEDQDICTKFHNSSLDDKHKTIELFSQTYLKELAIRIMGRHFQGNMSTEHLEQFHKYIEKVKCVDPNKASVDYKGQHRLNISDALQEINSLQSLPLDAEQKILLNELLYYLQNKF